MVYHVPHLSKLCELAQAWASYSESAYRCAEVLKISTRELSRQSLVKQKSLLAITVLLSVAVNAL